MAKLDLPNGWTCISCGDEYLEDTTGKDVANYDEGTLCLKCERDSKQSDFPTCAWWFVQTLNNKATICELMFWQF